MNRILRLLAATTVSASLATAGASLAAGVSTAGASTNVRPLVSAAAPPWEPDPSSVGAIVFYNAAGQVVTGGNLTDQPVAAYAEGQATVRAGDTTATLYGFLPVDGLTPGQWSGEALGASTAYPNASAPGALATSSLPVETGGDTDESIGQLVADWPNNDTSDDGYAGMYQLRLYTSKAGEGISTDYDSADIEVDKSAGTWSVFYAPLPTSTSVRTSATSIDKGQSVTLTATETPAVAGSVQFYDGSATLGSPVSSSSGTAAYTTTALPAGTDVLKAVFTPSDTNLDDPSTSSTVDVLVKQTTTTTLTASPTSITRGQKVTFTATEAPAEAGSITFYDGKTGLAKVTVNSKGVATYATTALPAGSLTITAYYVPASNLYAGSNGSVKVTVKT